jgi:hypothetical protein
LFTLVQKPLNTAASEIRMALFRSASGSVLGALKRLLQHNRANNAWIRTDLRRVVCNELINKTSPPR